MTKRNVMISISTSRVELAQSLFAEDGDEVDIDEFDLPTDEDGEPTELLIEGRLVTGRDRVELVWEESELSGMAGSVTTLGFDRSNPGLISMMRAGTVSTAMVFEAHKRHVSVYDTPFSSFQISVYTRDVENALLSEGMIYLDYLIEVHGAAAEHCVMTISVKSNDPLF